MRIEIKFTNLKEVQRHLARLPEQTGIKNNTKQRNIVQKDKQNVVSLTMNLHEQFFRKMQLHGQEDFPYVCEAQAELYIRNRICAYWL